MRNSLDSLRRLLSPANRDVPPDISGITDYLYIAAHPQDGHVGGIHELGITLVLNMIWFPPARKLSEPPFRMVTLRTFDSPVLRIPVATLCRGVEFALSVIEQDGRVLVYCREGRHRSVAMASCILISCGYDVDDAMDLIVSRRPVADPRAAHIEQQIRAFATQWKAGKEEVTGDE